MALTPLVVDLSHHNTVNSFADIAKWGIAGVIHKATQGTHFVDKTYAKRKGEAIKAGLLWGAYHFGDDTDPEQQVNHFLDTIKYDGKTLIALDYEPNPNGGEMSIEQAKAWLEIAFDKTKQRPVLYSGHLIKEQDLKGDEEFWKQHRLWLAQYSSSYKLPAAWDDMWLWQYTGDGLGDEPHEVDGVQGVLDINKFDGDAKLLAQQWLGLDVGEIAFDDPMPTNKPKRRKALKAQLKDIAGSPAKMK